MYYKSHKKCHKNFENLFMNEHLTPRNDLDMVFYMCVGGYTKKCKFRIVANLESQFGDCVQEFGPHLGISLYLALI